MSIQGVPQRRRRRCIYLLLLLQWLEQAAARAHRVQHMGAARTHSRGQQRRGRVQQRAVAAVHERGAERGVAIMDVSK